MVPEAKRLAVVELYQLGKTQKEIGETLTLSRRTIENTIRRHRETGGIQDRPRSGRPRTSITPVNIRKVRDKVRQEAKRSMRKMAKELQISRGSVQDIVKEHLGLRSIKMQKTHALTDQMKATRLQRCRELLKRFSAVECEAILFTDEKLFNVELFNRVETTQTLALMSKQQNRMVATSPATVIRRRRLIDGSDVEYDVFVVHRDNVSIQNY